METYLPPRPPHATYAQPPPRGRKSSKPSAASTKNPGHGVLEQATKLPPEKGKENGTLNVEEVAGKTPPHRKTKKNK